MPWSVCWILHHWFGPTAATGEHDAASPIRLYLHDYDKVAVKRVPHIAAADVESDGECSILNEKLQK